MGFATSSSIEGLQAVLGGHGKDTGTYSFSSDSSPPCSTQHSVLSAFARLSIHEYQFLTSSSLQTKARPSLSTTQVPPAMVRTLPESLLPKQLTNSSSYRFPIVKPASMESLITKHTFAGYVVFSLLFPSN